MEPLDYKPPTGPLEIIHRDEALLVVNKPAGLLTVPGKDPAHADCLLSRVEAEDEAALLVHRLDMDTSGVVIFARKKTAQRHLGLQFERRHLEKRYEALVTGELPGQAGQVDASLTSDWPNRPLQKICEETGRPAQTEWSLMAREAGQSRVRLVPLTGRTHQLRVHMMSLDAPIVGDRFYGGAAAERLMLHACALRLRHPDGGRWVSFISPVPF